MKPLWKPKILTFLLIAILAFITGCSNNTAPATTVADSEQNQTPEQSITLDTSPTTVTPGQKLKISYIDVGQADSILIQIPNGKNVLIDAGNNGDADTVTSYIKKQNINKLDIVIATHPHEDHIGSMDTVIQTFDVGQFIMPKKDATTQTYIDMVTALQSKEMKITVAKAGLVLDLGSEANALLIAPNSTDYENTNNYSAVLKLSYGNNTFLFTGDAEEQSETEMINAGFNLKSDVLKVGHHGSNTSSKTDFLAKVQPKHAVISVGKDNSYGHPANVTISNLTDVKAEISRTDLAGTIIIESDGTNITIETIASEVQPQAPPQEEKQPEPEPAPVTSTPAPEPTPAPAVTPTPETTPAPAQTQSTTVYITKTGEKYHSDGCSYLSKSKISISLSDAKSRGYGPCSRCSPPK